jgi:tetratricopeptide (TPR) repeat protein
MTAIRAVMLALLMSTAALAAATELDPLGEARGHYELGMSHYEVGEFLLAIDEFKIAYAASHAPGLLFNLAQASRLARQYDQALFFYRSFLRARPDAPNRADVEARILEVESLAAAAHQRHPRGDGAEPPPPTSEPAPPVPAPPAPAATTTATVTATASAAAPRPRNGRRERIVGLVTGGVGLAALGIGIYFGTQALSAQDHLGGVATWDASAQSLYTRGHNDAIAATTLYVAGGAAVAAGAALYVWGWRRDVRARRFAVAPLPGGAQASFSCAF